MSKQEKVFNDYFQQGLFESLRQIGYTKREAKREVIKRFQAYDNDKEIIFVK